MDLATTIRTRRTVTAFTDQAVAPELVLELLETAVWVPNHRLTEPWRFVLLMGDSTARYADIRRTMALDACTLPDGEARRLVGDKTYQKFSGVPAFLAIIMEESKNPEIREEDYASCCCLVQNFLLLARERGLGTCWKTFKRDARLRELLKLADNETVVGWLHLGYPNRLPEPTQRSSAGARFTILDAPN